MPSIGKEDCYDSGSWLIDLLKLLSQPRLHESCKIQSLAPQGWVWFEVMFCRRPVAGLGERWEMNPAVGPSSSFRFKGVRKIVFVAMPQFPIWDGWQRWRAVSLHCRSDLGIPRRESQRGGGAWSARGVGLAVSPSEPLGLCLLCLSLQKDKLLLRSGICFLRFKHKRSSPDTLHNVTLRLE